MCEFESRSWRWVCYTTSCDQVCQWLATGRWNTITITVTMVQESKSQLLWWYTSCICRCEYNFHTIIVMLVKCCALVCIYRHLRQILSYMATIPPKFSAIWRLYRRFLPCHGVSIWGSKQPALESWQNRDQVENDSVITSRKLDRTSFYYTLVSGARACNKSGDFTQCLAKIILTMTTKKKNTGIWKTYKMLLTVYPPSCWWRSSAYLTNGRGNFQICKNMIY